MVQTRTDSEDRRERLETLLDPDLFRALGDPNRITLIAHLGEDGGSSTVTQASECCPVDVSVVSRHLRTLRSAGVVTAEKEGRQVHYRVEHRALASRLREIADALENCCPDDCC
jgi:DNA-binding transcriptional ArsR family regulator